MKTVFHQTICRVTCLALIGLFLMGCDITPSELKLTKGSSASTLAPEVTSVKVVGGKLVLDGNNLKDVTAVKISGNGVDSLLSIHSASATQVVALALSVVGVKANLTYQILVSTASASTTITATIEIEDASLEVDKLSSGTGNAGKLLTASSSGAPTWESLSIADASIVNGKLSSGSGNTGKVLTAAASGAPTWESPAGGGISSCPAGFTLVGTSGSISAFCISGAQAVGTYFDAVAGCAGLTPSASICNTNQFTRAYHQLGATADWTSGDYHWISDLASKPACDAQAWIVRESGGVSLYFYESVLTDSYAYRCCLP